MSPNKPIFTSFLPLAIVIPLLLSSLPLAFSTCRESDILLRLESEFNPQFYKFYWDPATDCCTSWSGVICDDNGTVVQLGINGGYYYNGTLPRSLGDLTGLVRIQMFDFRNMTGPLPEFLTNLQSLEELTIIDSQLSGRLPSFLSIGFPKLTTLNLKKNKFEGSIPHCFGPNLTYINLSENKLTGRIPSCLGAKHADIALHGNGLSGRIPGTFFTGRNLDLANNNLVGKIPPAFAEVNFTMLELNGNRLTGDASLLFGVSKPLWWINLSYNRFNFDLSKVKYPTGIMYIRMNNNNITGGISETINGVSFVSELNLAYNELCGPIPPGPTTARFPHAFDHNKCLCGAPLPPCA